MLLKRILLIRHARTEANEQKRFETRGGWLSREGMRQSKLLGKHLRKFSFSHVYSSPLHRAVETAKVAGFKNPLLKEGLRERNYGGLEGRKWNKVLKLVITRHMLDEALGVESMQQVQERASKLFESISRKEGNSVLFTHHDVIAGLLCYVTGTPLEFFRVFKLDNASVTELVWEEGLWRIARLNDTSFLL